MPQNNVCKHNFGFYVFEPPEGSGVLRGGFGVFKPPPLNSEGPPKLCHTQPDL